MGWDIPPNFLERARLKNANHRFNGISFYGQWNDRIQRGVTTLGALDFVYNPTNRVRKEGMYQNKIKIKIKGGTGAGEKKGGR